MKDLLLGIDVGTYSSKATLATLQGEVVGTAAIPHDISLPAPGHVEQDADRVWWHDVCALSRMVLGTNPAQAQRIAALAVSAIGPCLLPLDRTMQPLRPGILYGVDVRAHREIDALEALLGRDAVQQHSGMGLSSQSIGPKMLWLRQHEPQVWARTAMLTTASAYLVFRLTGRHFIDRHTASYFMPLYDPKRGGWNDRLGSGLATPDMLPAPAWSDELAGTLTAEAAAATGLPQGIPVAVGAVDALSEAISVGVTQPGDLMVMYGSTTFFVLVQQHPTPDPRLWSVSGAFAGHTNLAAGMSTTGSLTQWFKDELARDLGTDGYEALFAAAVGVEPGAQGLLVLPYFSGERTPVNDPRASGVIAGLTLAHTREHLFRAVLEGVGHGVRHNLDTFAAIGAEVRRVVAVGGGAQSDAWLQIVSDITGVAQEVPAVSIGASYGDAFLAGRAAGLLAPADIQRWVRPGRTVQPRAALRPLYDRLHRQYLALYAGTRDVMHQLHGAVRGH